MEFPVGSRKGDQGRMSNVMELQSLDDFVKVARQLRQESEEAEARFLLFLREFELHREDLWKTAGVASFDSFLQSSQLINCARYRNFCAGARLLSDVEKAGAGAAVAAAAFKQPTTEGMRKFEENVAAFRSVHGAPPSEQTARDWVRQLDEKSPKVVRQATRLRELEAENQALKAENRELRRKVQVAERELARHRKKAAA